ncbi:MAG: pyridoxamine 5'-phosphate oxidase family protein [Thaumarchaeota archaeon]|nr:pyridoxamine 5'-phosphate oxidase family protein [Nitrososphaerota archaeon]
MTKFTPGQVKFLKSHDLCRLATASEDGMPHVTPVIYALDGDAFVIAADYGTKKLANLKKNPKVSLVVDEYGESNKGLMIQGECTTLEKGAEYLRLLRVLLDRFEYYRENPWGEGEAPILRIVPEKIAVWGL